jgi:DNA-binding NarL/FixJ family response regulator
VIRLFIVDKDWSLGETMTAILSGEPDIVVVGAAVSVADALPYLGDCDLILVTADLSCEGVLQLARAASGRSGGPQVVLMDWDRTQEAFLQYAAAGVADYALEDDSLDELLTKMRSLQEAKRREKPSIGFSGMSLLFDSPSIKSSAK